MSFVNVAIKKNIIDLYVAQVFEFFQTHFEFFEQCSAKIKQKAQNILDFIQHYNPNYISLLVYQKKNIIELLILLKTANINTVLMETIINQMHEQCESI